MQIARRRAPLLIRAFGLNIARGGNVSTFNSIKGETVRASKKRCRTSRVEVYIYIYISRRSDETRGLMHSGYFRMGDIMEGKLEEERIFFPFWFEYIYLK